MAYVATVRHNSKECSACVSDKISPFPFLWSAFLLFIFSSPPFKIFHLVLLAKDVPLAGKGVPSEFLLHNLRQKKAYNQALQSKSSQIGKRKITYQKKSTMNQEILGLGW